MGPLRKFEKRLERLFEQPFTKVFKGGVHPLEIARRLIREIDDAKVLGVSGVMAPNHFTVSLSPPDYERLSGVAGSLAAEMEAMVITHTNQRDYHLLTRPRVEFERDPSLREGEFSVVASLDEPAGLPPAVGDRVTVQSRGNAEGRLGVLMVISGEEAGNRLNLDMDRARIGRAEENDLVLPDPRASRFHAEIAHSPSGYVVRDLGSTNGTMVKGRKVRERLLEDGDTLLIGETELRFGFIPDPRGP
jgi:FhaA, N-terminal domain/FHA domain